MPANVQTDAFQKPAEYWLRRAERCLKSGDAMRAAALLRHAAHIEPDHMEIRLGYAYALYELHCYEASNREAIAAAAIEPMSRAPYGLMSMNYLALGMNDMALDTYHLYANSTDFDDDLPWDEEYDDTEDALFLLRPKRRHARLDGLIRKAIKLLGKLNIKGAKEALEHAVRIQPSERYANRYFALALYYETVQSKALALENTMLALSRPNLSPAKMATLACVLSRLGEPTASKLALVKAAALALRLPDELMVVLSAHQLQMLPLAKNMLQRNLRMEPNRMATCYNLAVCLLRLNDMEGASRYLHLCREIDPDDIQSEQLFARLVEWEEAGVTPSLNDIRTLTYYQGMGIVQFSEALKPINAALLKGPEAFASALQTDHKLYKRFLFLLSMRADELGRLLPDVVPRMQPSAAKRMLREILLGECKDERIKQLAVAQLAELCDDAPLSIRRGDHIMRGDPTVPPPAHASLLKRLLFGQIRRAVRYDHTSAIAPFALELVARMSKQQRKALATDRTGIWTLAICMVYAKKHGAHTDAVFCDLSEEQLLALHKVVDELERLLRSKEEPNEAD